MSFRKYIEPARSKRVAHIDLHAQLIQRQSLGGFPEGADEEFLEDLQEFVQTANEYFNPGDHLPITVAMLLWAMTLTSWSERWKNPWFSTAVPNATKANGLPLFSITRPALAGQPTEKKMIRNNAGQAWKWKQ
jgi:hypothetical protein